MKSNSCYILGTKIFFGNGSLSQIHYAIKELACSQPLILVDPLVLKSGSIDSVFDIMTKEGLSYTLFEHVIQNSSTDSVDEAAEIARNNHNDMIIAIGGGSTIDTGKTTALLAKQEGSVLDYLPNIGKNFNNKKLPLLTIPTTSGTGSELSIYAVHTNSISKEKFCFTGPLFTSNAVILDPQLTLSMPRTLTIATASDALVHGIEAYTSKTAIHSSFPYIDALSLESIRLIRHNLPIILSEPNNIDARLNMMFASALGGAVIGYGVGAAHGMDSTLLKYFGMPHGVAVAQLIPSVMEYNQISCPKQMKDIAGAMGVNVSGLNDNDASILAAKAVKEFLHSIDIPPLIKYVTSLKTLLDTAAEMLTSYSVVENIRPLTLQDIELILTSAYKN